MLIKFCSTKSVLNFIDFVNDFESNITIYDGHIEIDAKSTIGMMNIPINKMLRVEINAISDMERDKFMRGMKNGCGNGINWNN